jgi:hypothetical protein
MRKSVSTFILASAISVAAISGFAGEAISAPSPRGNCVAKTITTVIHTADPATFRRIVLDDAHDGGAGEFIAPRASANHCPPPP